jgi:3-hydroxybutyrate dehydrogenase
VCPGYVRTPLVERQIDEQARAHGIPAAEVLERVILTRQARKELIEPSDVAATVAFVLAPAGRSYTGSQMVMGNGWTAS